MFKRGLECHSVIRERSRRYGQTSKDRDLAKWTRTRRRMVRREDILSSITGKSPPTRQSAPTASAFGRHAASLGRSSESFGVAVRSRNSPQRRSPRPSTSTTQTHKPRRNSLFNKDLSHLQVTILPFKKGKPFFDQLSVSSAKRFSWTFLWKINFWRQFWSIFWVIDEMNVSPKLCSTENL